MLTRRDLLCMIPPALLVGAARAAPVADFGRIDTHIHIHRDAPALLSAIKEANWRGLDIVVCPASGGETFDLEDAAPRHPEGVARQRRCPGLGVDL